MIDLKRIPAEVLDTLTLLQSNGFRSFLVGGSVRDLLLDKTPKDFDICTAAAPEEVRRVFDKVIDTGLKFGTVTVLRGPIPIEVTTFRKGICPGNGFRQGVTTFSGSEVEDVNARDFTINALLFDGRKVIDYVNGLTDLKEKLIRTVGKPEYRFREDALRTMRAIRLCSQLRFEIEKSTLDSIASNAPLIVNTSSERIRDELIKILMSEKPSNGIRLMRKTGLLTYVIPELQSNYKIDQRSPCHGNDVFEHIMAVLDHTPNNPIVRLAALFHDIENPHNTKGSILAENIMSRLKFDRKTIDSVSIIVKEHMTRLKVLRKPSVKKLINRIGPDRIQLLIDLQIADEAGAACPNDIELLERLRKEVNRILKEKEPVSIKDLAVDGQDLIQKGVKEGPQIGKMLNRLLGKVHCNPELNNKEELLRIVADKILR